MIPQEFYKYIYQTDSCSPTVQDNRVSSTPQRVAHYFSINQSQFFQLNANERFLFLKKIVRELPQTSSIKVITHQAYTIFGRNDLERALQEHDLYLAQEIIESYYNLQFEEVIEKWLRGQIINAEIAKFVIVAQLSTNSKSNKLLNLISNFLNITQIAYDPYIFLLIKKSRLSILVDAIKEGKIVGLSGSLFRALSPRDKIIFQSDIQSPKILDFFMDFHKNNLRFPVKNSIEIDFLILLNIDQSIHSHNTDFNKKIIGDRFRYLLSRSSFIHFIVEHPEVISFLLFETDFSENDLIWVIRLYHNRFEVILRNLTVMRTLIETHRFVLLLLLTEHLDSFAGYGWTDKLVETWIEVDFYRNNFLNKVPFTEELITYVEPNNFEYFIQRGFYCFLQSSSQASQERIILNFLGSCFFCKDKLIELFNIAGLIAKLSDFSYRQDLLTLYIGSNKTRAPLDLSFIQFCLEDLHSIDSSLIKKIISFPNYESGDLDKLIEAFADLKNQIQSLILELDINKMNNSAVKDLFRLFRDLTFKHNKNLFHILLESFDLYNCLDLIDFEWVRPYLFQVDDFGMTPLSYTMYKEPIASEHESLLIRLGTFTQLFKPSIYLHMLALNNRKLFDHWMSETPLLWEVFKAPFESSDTDILFEFLEALTSFQLQRLRDLGLEFDPLVLIDSKENSFFHRGVYFNESEIKEAVSFLNEMDETPLWNKNLVMVKFCLDHGALRYHHSAAKENFLHALLCRPLKGRNFWIASEIFSSYPDIYYLLFVPNYLGQTPFAIALEESKNLDFLKTLTLPQDALEVLKLFEGVAHPKDGIKMLTLLSRYTSHSIKKFIAKFQDLFTPAYLEQTIQCPVDLWETIFSLLEVDEELMWQLIQCAYAKKILPPADLKDDFFDLLMTLVQREPVPVFVQELLQKVDLLSKNSEGRVLFYEMLRGKHFAIQSVLEKLDLHALSLLAVESLRQQFLHQKMEEVVKDKMAHLFSTFHEIGLIDQRDFPMEIDKGEIPFEALDGLFLFKLNKGYTQIPIPKIEIPARENCDQFIELLPLFEKYVMKVSLNFTPRDDDKRRVSLLEMKERLQQLLLYIGDRRPYAGVPPDVEERNGYYAELKTLLSHLVDLLKEEKDVERVQSALVDLAMSGPSIDQQSGHCGTRWRREAYSHYALLKGFNGQFSPQENLLIFLSKLRVEDHYKLVARYGWNMHFDEQLRYLIGAERGLPLEGTPRFDSLGCSWTKEKALEEFDKIHSLFHVTSEVHNYFNDSKLKEEVKAPLLEWLKSFADNSLDSPFIQEKWNQVEELADKILDQLNQDSLQGEHAKRVVIDTLQEFGIYVSEKSIENFVSIKERAQLIELIRNGIKILKRNEFLSLLYTEERGEYKLNNYAVLLALKNSGVIDPDPAAYSAALET